MRLFYILFLVLYLYQPNLAAAKEPKTCKSYILTVRGKSMEPLLKDGDILAFKPPHCTTVEKGDLVAFITPANLKAPVIKRVVGVSGDKLKIKRQKPYINGIPALGADNQPYAPTSQGLRMLSLYEGIIPKDRILVLGRPGMLDSGRIGLIRINRLVGIKKAP